MPAIIFVFASAGFASAGFGLIMGWTAGHHEVARECQRLGAFYVGEKTFECKERK